MPTKQKRLTLAPATQTVLADPPIIGENSVNPYMLQLTDGTMYACRYTVNHNRTCWILRQEFSTMKKRAIMCGVMPVHYYTIHVKRGEWSAYSRAWSSTQSGTPLTAEQTAVLIAALKQAAGIGG